MDTAVAFVQAYLNVNGYFTGVEYPVLEASRGSHARSVTDLDILALRFAGAGHDVIRGRRHDPLGGRVFGPDPVLGCPADRPDMIVGEVKEGTAHFNSAMRDPVVLEIALTRFGCCPPDHAQGLTRQLLSRGEVETPAIVLCDRGTIDGAAYWPGPDDLWSAVGTTLDEQLRRYDAVIHLRTPAPALGYNWQNPLRTESAAEAGEVDARIGKAWERHPRRFPIEPSPNFLDKAARAVEILRGEMPECCKRHVIPVLNERDRNKDMSTGGP